MKTCLLVYDIPTASSVANPSRRLRRCGFRINLSAWVLPSDHVPWGLLDSLKMAGVTWHLAEFAESEGRKLVELAVAALTAEVKAARERAAKSAARSAAGLEAGGATAEALKLYHRRTRAALARAERLLKDAEVAAAAFDIDPAALPFGDTRTAIAALQSACHSRAALYAEMAARVQDEKAAALARADLVPALVLADMLEEEGTESEPLRVAFAS